MGSCNCDKTGGAFKGLGKTGRGECSTDGGAESSGDGDEHDDGSKVGVPHNFS